MQVVGRQILPFSFHFPVMVIFVYENSRLFMCLVQSCMLFLKSYHPFLSQLCIA